MKNAFTLMGKRSAIFGAGTLRSDLVTCAQREALQFISLNHSCKDFYHG